MGLVVNPKKAVEVQIVLPEKIIQTGIRLPFTSGFDFGD